MPRQRYSDPIRFLGDFHDFMRALYYLKDGLTKYQFAKLMSVDDSAAMARLNGWVRAGVVEHREDGKYYLRAGRILVDGFGEITINDGSIQITIDPLTKFVRKARRGMDSVAIRVLPPPSPESQNGPE